MMSSQQTELLKKLDLPLFQPLPWLKSGITQTLASAFWPYLPQDDFSFQHSIPLEDQDKLIIVEDRPPGWKPGNRIVLLVHGLGGHHLSNYIVRLSRSLMQEGILTFRMNLRGCGLGVHHAKLPYHCGRSEDTRAVIQWITSNYPGSPITQVGYSLGGNITLKMAGEDSSSPTGNLDSIIAVSPPVDLIQNSKHLQKPRYLLFDQFFVHKLKFDIWRHSHYHPDLPKAQFPLKMNLKDLDELYTAPRSGFQSAHDYYQKAACGPWIPKIKVKSLILCSTDDPIVHAASYSSLEIPKVLQLLMPEAGGHVGFIGSTGRTRDDFQWMDLLLTRWIVSL